MIKLKLFFIPIETYGKRARSVMPFIFLLQQSFGQCPTSAPGFVQKPRQYGITTRKKVEIIFWRYSRMILAACKGYVHRYKEVIKMYIWYGNCHLVPNWTSINCFSSFRSITWLASLAFTRTHHDLTADKVEKIEDCLFLLNVSTDIIFSLLGSRQT